MASLGLRAAGRELGISHVALLKAAKTGRVPRDPDGLFDIEACRVALSRNTHPLKSGYARRLQQDPPPGALPRVDSPASRLPVDPPVASEVRSLIEELAGSRMEGQPSSDQPPGSDSIAEATRQLEWQRYREKKLKVDREEGKLVEVVAVNAFVAGMILQARDELIRMATEMRDEMAHTADPLKCEELLLTRISSILGKMSEYRRES
jgi:hypothetical protein